MVGFFSGFIKGLPLQLTAGKYAIELSVLKLCLKDDLETSTFQIRLVDKPCFLFSKYLTSQIIWKQPGLPVCS